MPRLLLFVAACCWLPAAPATAAPEAHMVFFTLADSTDANRERLVAACHEHLSDHEGVLYFSVGERAEERSRPVNDTSFDVALHLVFDSPESHDKYQTHPRHLAFIKACKPLWAKVVVFDSLLARPDSPE